MTINTLIRTNQNTVTMRYVVNIWSRYCVRAPKSAISQKDLIQEKLLRTSFLEVRNHDFLSESTSFWIPTNAQSTKLSTK